MKYMYCTLLISLISGCASSEKASEAVLLHVTVVDDEGTHLSDVPVRLNGRKLSPTGSNGTTHTLVQEQEGRVMMLEIECPTSHKPETPGPRQLTIRHLQRENGLQPMEETFICRPTQKPHVLIVRTNRSEALPIRITGTQAGNTDSDGVAHLVVKGAPGQELDVVIDTARHPSLRPASPSRRLSLPEQSRFLIFQQNFEERLSAKSPKKRRSVHKPKGPKRL